MVSDKELKSNIPLFVKGGDDHKCGKCAYRTGKDGCIIMEGKISFQNGTCLYWAEGGASKEMMPMRLTKEEAQYMETDGKIQCGTCRLFKDNKCMLWGGDPVEAEDCCIAWTDGKSFKKEGSTRSRRMALVRKLFAQHAEPCPWCQMYRPGKPANMVPVEIEGSHGMCKECFNLAVAEIDAENEKRSKEGK